MGLGSTRREEALNALYLALMVRYRVESHALTQFDLSGSAWLLLCSRAHWYFVLLLHAMTHSLDTIDRIGRKRLQVMGFAAIALLYLILGAAFTPLQSTPALFLFIYGLICCLSFCHG